MRSFLRALEMQRWDDHRYYHHSRINQSLHLLSALCFLAAYATLFLNAALSALIGWLMAMVSRQVGHFFFEPKGYDLINQASHAHKEHIKIGYNLQRKRVLLSIWGLSPLLLWAEPTLFGVYPVHDGHADFIAHLGELWLALGLGALLFRAVQLCVLRGVLTGVVWMAKILTDPFHDIMLYHRAPLCLLRGELIDPMAAARERGASP